MKPKTQGHVSGNTPYHQEDIKQDAFFEKKPISESQYQDGDNMTYSEKEASKQLPEASSWPKFSGIGEYDHMELIDYIDGLFTDVPSIPDYWITARLNTDFKGHASIWYTETCYNHGNSPPWIPYGISSHSPFMANWPYPSPVANMATSSSYGPFVFWGLHGPSPQSRSHSGNLCPNWYFWSFPSKPGEMAQMAVFGHLGS
ncbi:hypothetical protein O181_008975 [Austropuccinia psidii MF-1]|uniref:Uncharacterized protein n=1 Tax=Austropuccinia psidii MF-1 TaxID=1389203 RepID=A0A9Q3BQZ3_9BASI|nr:hypothetical protein [Austropuccinia psidii MF-1]